MPNKSPLLNWEIWLRGLLAAFIGGGSGSVTSGLASMGIDPEHFNLGSGLRHTFALMGAVFLVNGALSVFLYLKQSPLPTLESGTQTSGQTMSFAPLGAGTALTH
jgi:hypothetical protein